MKVSTSRRGLLFYERTQFELADQQMFHSLLAAMNTGPEFPAGTGAESGGGTSRRFDTGMSVVDKIWVQYNCGESKCAYCEDSDPRNSGAVSEAGPIEKLLAAACDEIHGSDEAGMKAYKLNDRTERMEWTPPVLTFDIERHGAAALGSTLAEIQAWAIVVPGSNKQTREDRSRRFWAALIEELIPHGWVKVRRHLEKVK
jgi:hypothetical protein